MSWRVDLRGRGSAWRGLLLRRVVACRGVFRLLSPGLDLHGRGSAWALCLLSVSPAGVCVVACRGVFLLLSRAGFAWQRQHLGTLSVVCVGGGRLCRGVFWRVLLAVSTIYLHDMAPDKVSEHLLSISDTSHLYHMSPNKVSEHLLSLSYVST